MGLKLQHEPRPEPKHISSKTYFQELGPGQVWINGYLPIATSILGDLFGQW